MADMVAESSVKVGKSDDWQKELIVDVVSRIRLAGGAIQLPRRGTVDGMMRSALAGVFERVSELQEKVSELVGMVEEGVSQPRPREDLVSRAGLLKEDDLLRSEQEWLNLFQDCRVAVKDDVVGMQLMKDALESPSKFTALVGMVAAYKGLVVPLLEYPGVKLFDVMGDSAKKASKASKNPSEEEGQTT